MVHALATTPAITDETLIACFKRYVDRGYMPYLAAEAAVRDLCRAGHQEDLIKEVLPALLFQRWEDEAAPARSRGQRDRRQREIDDRADQTDAGRRRVRVDVLKRSDSLMESLFEVDGVWHRIGDMDRAMCHQASRTQKLAALQRAQYANFFAALAKGLTGGDTVRHALSEDDVARLFNAARPGAGAGH